MILTPEQIEMRRYFRERVIDLFYDEKRTLMFNIINDVAEKFKITPEESAYKLSEIPSIGRFGYKTPISAWLARHYPKVAAAMFDKKGVDAAMEIWKTQKYQAVTNATKKRSSDVMREMANTRKNVKKNRAIAELRANMPDRWANTSWKVVK